MIWILRLLIALTMGPCLFVLTLPPSAVSTLLFWLAYGTLLWLAIQLGREKARREGPWPR